MAPGCNLGPTDNASPVRFTSVVSADRWPYTVGYVGGQESTWVRCLVVLISGEADAEMIADAMKHGAVDFVKKPVDARDLDRRLRDVLARARLDSGTEEEQEENESATGVNQSTDAQQNAADPAEREQVLAALKEAGGHLGRAAEILGYSYSKMHRRMKQLGIEKEFK